MESDTPDVTEYRIFREVIEKTPDKIVVLDPLYNTIFLNRAATGSDFRYSNPCTVDPDELIFHDTGQEIFRRIYRETLKSGKISREITYGDPPFPRTVKMTTMRVEDANEVIAVVAHIADITEAKLSLQELLLANKKLHMLIEITRHDILNQIQIILSLLSVLGDLTDDAPGEGMKYRDMIEESTGIIQQLLKFTGQYHDMGMHELLWVPVETVIEETIQLFHIPSVKISLEAEGLELFTDPLILKVFFNLMENSIRHGETVSSIRVYWYFRGDTLVLVWKDNGRGVPDDKKEEIFRRYVGDHTGVGLYMIREILSLSGISIREAGTEGKGARFEMTIPAGCFRFNDTG
ncbi:MAG: ATP-binding protein [Methanospirillum sp.]|nr:ATP-binding protein [Methanospirillum sp.]